MSASPENANERINSWLERIVFAFITVAIGATATFQWQLYKANEDIRLLLTQHNSRIDSLNDKIAAQDSRISELKAQMVGWDTLKRIELFLSSQPSKEVDRKMQKALSIELESRKNSGSR